MKKRNALVVEDETEISDAIQQSLLRAGIESQACTTAIDAIRLLENEQFGCVLLDMRLARGTGKNVLTFLTTHPKQAQLKTPVLLISGNLSLDLLRSHKGQIAGALVKPFKPSELVSRVELLLDEKDPERDSDLPHHAD